jgi:hypothetical protein
MQFCLDGPGGKALQGRRIRDVAASRLKKFLPNWYHNRSEGACVPLGGVDKVFIVDFIYEDFFYRNSNISKHGEKFSKETYPTK